MPYKIHRSKSHTEEGNKELSSLARLCKYFKQRKRTERTLRLRLIIKQGRKKAARIEVLMLFVIPCKYIRQGKMKA